MMQDGHFAVWVKSNRTYIGAVRSALVLAVLLPAAALAQSVDPLALLSESVAGASQRVAYGPGEMQVGELRVPDSEGPHPVVMLIHGGCWAHQLKGMDARATSFELLRPMAAALANAGIATWNVEYRRAGSPGGEWPAAFEDLSRAADFLRQLAPKVALDLNRVLVAGHSSGGQLAMWIAARPKLPASSRLYSKDPLAVKAVVNLDGPVDPAAFLPYETKVCGMPAITQFMGGTAEEHPARYQDSSAASFLPLGVPQEFIAGALIANTREQIVAYQASARAKGDVVTVTALEGAGHFDMLAPRSPHWKTVEARFRTLLR